MQKEARSVYYCQVQIENVSLLQIENVPAKFRKKWLNCKKVGLESRFFT